MRDILIVKNSKYLKYIIVINNIFYKLASASVTGGKKCGSSFTHASGAISARTAVALLFTSFGHSASSFMFFSIASFTGFACTT